MTAFRVFSGWDSRQTEAAEVFAYSVRWNASIDVTVTQVSAGTQALLVGTDAGDLDCLTVNLNRTGVTAFTYARFMVPWICGYEGRALFADGCDQLCLGNVRELAEWDMEGKPIWVVKHPSARTATRDRQRSWTSLMLFDCSQFEHWTPLYVAETADDHLMCLRDFTDEQIGVLPEEWNFLSLEGTPTVAPAGVKLLHWSYLAHPNGGSWIDRSKSPLWAEWRERWRAEQDAA